MSIAFQLTLNFLDSTCVDQSKIGIMSKISFVHYKIHIKSHYAIDRIEGEDSICIIPWLNRNLSFHHKSYTNY